MRILLFCLSLAALSAAPAEPLRGVCTRVVDGDTIVVEVGGELRIVRVWGVDCPERRPREWYAEEAKAFTAAMCEGKAVVLDVADVDRYGRLVCRVTVGRRSLERALLENGCAFTYFWHPHHLEHEFNALMTNARTQQTPNRGVGLGLWARLQNPRDDPPQRKSTLSLPRN